MSWAALAWGADEGDTLGLLPAQTLAEAPGPLFLAAEIETFRPGGTAAVTDLPWAAAAWAAEEETPAAIADFSTLRVSDAGWVTRASDPGGVQAYAPTLAAGLELDRAMDLAPDGIGAAAGWGALVLVNDAGALDALARGSNVDGRAIRVRIGRKQPLAHPVTAGGALLLLGPDFTLPAIEFRRSHSPAGVEASRLDADGQTWRLVAPAVLRRTGPARRLLIEAAGTNLVAHARTPGSTGWLVTGIPDATPDVGPDGAAGGATLLNEGTATSQHLTQFNAAAVTSGLPYVISVLVAPGSASLVQLSTLAAGFGGAQTLNFNLTGAGSAGTPTGGVTGFGIDRAGDWYRCWMAGVASGTSAASGFLLSFLNLITNGRAPSFAGTGRTLRVAWAQMEQGTFPSSPILPPVGAPGAATRGEDMLGLPLAAIGAAGTGAGTILGTVLLPQTVAAGQFPHLVAMSNNTTAERALLYNVGGGTALNWAVSAGGVSQTDSGVGNFTPGQLLRFGIAFGGTRAAISLDGAAPAIRTNAAAPTLTEMHIGNRFDGARPVSGEFGTVRSMPYVMTDAELAAAVAALPA